MLMGHRPANVAYFGALLDQYEHGPALIVKLLRLTSQPNQVCAFLVPYMAANAHLYRLSYDRVLKNRLHDGFGMDLEVSATSCRNASQVRLTFLAKPTLKRKNKHLHP